MGFHNTKICGFRKLNDAEVNQVSGGNYNEDPMPGDPNSNPYQQPNIAALFGIPVYDEGADSEGAGEGDSDGNYILVIGSSDSGGGNAYFGGSGNTQGNSSGLPDWDELIETREEFLERQNELWAQIAELDHIVVGPTGIDIGSSAVGINQITGEPSSFSYTPPTVSADIINTADQHVDASQYPSGFDVTMAGVSMATSFGAMMETGGLSTAQFFANLTHFSLELNEYLIGIHQTSGSLANGAIAPGSVFVMTFADGSKAFWNVPESPIYYQVDDGPIESGPNESGSNEVAPTINFH